MTPARILIIGVIAYVGFTALKKFSGERADIIGGIAGDITQGVATVKKSITGWSLDLVPQQYRAAIAAAELANGIPSGMLARLLYQESHYRTDIISGKTKSPVGAIGIAQFMPDTANDWDVNPLDPFSSIAGAGRYLAWLYRYTGGWDKALASYNWGVGNVTRKGLSLAPAETVTYYTSILSDIGLA